MKLWIISVGEPLPVDGENTRLRRMGNLASYASSNGVSVEWFSVSFDHYKKMQRCESDTDYCVNDNYVLHLVKSIPYKKNVSLARIRHHKVSSLCIQLNPIINGILPQIKAVCPTYFPSEGNIYHICHAPSKNA